MSLRFPLVGLLYNRGVRRFTPEKQQVSMMIIYGINHFPAQTYFYQARTIDSGWKGGIATHWLEFILMTMGYDAAIL